MGRLFGTDGIRGLANHEPMTPEFALKLGQALTIHAQKQNPEARIIIGKDTRRSGYMFETALTAGITSVGGHAIFLGPLPTAAVAYHIRGMRAQAGVMISASHNPFQDNGLKVFDEKGFKLSDEVEEQLEDWLARPDILKSHRAPPRKLGKASRMDDALGRYLGFLKSIFPRHLDLHDMKVVFDGANGAAYELGPKLFTELGAQVLTMACEPNGFNINQGGGQESLDLVSKKVLEVGADIGVSVDGDADRLQVVDEQGKPVSSEHLMFELLIHFEQKGRVTEKSFVTTEMSNQGLVEALKQNSFEVIRCPVGDRHVLAQLQARGLSFGGENSGHFLFLDQNTTADALLSALELLAFLRETGRKASELRSGFSLLPQKLVSLEVAKKPPLEELPELNRAIKSLEQKYRQRGRVQVRYSGTQNCLRFMLEGPSLEEIEKDLGGLLSLAKKSFEAVA